MEQYKDIFYSTSILVAVWIMAIGSSPTVPPLLDLCVMAAAAIYLIYVAIGLHKKLRRFMALIFIITALMPFLFYLQMYYVQLNATDIDKEVFKSNLMHAYVIYNIFRYTALLLSFICALRLFLRAVRDFASF